VPLAGQLPMPQPVPFMGTPCLQYTAPVFQESPPRPLQAPGVVPTSGIPHSQNPVQIYEPRTLGFCQTAVPVQEPPMVPPQSHEYAASDVARATVHPLMSQAYIYEPVRQVPREPSGAPRASSLVTTPGPEYGGQWGPQATPSQGYGAPSQPSLTHRPAEYGGQWGPQATLHQGYGGPHQPVAPQGLEYGTPWQQSNIGGEDHGERRRPSVTQSTTYGGPVQPSATQSPNYGGPLQPLVMVSSASIGHRTPLAPNTREYGGSRMNSSHTVPPGGEGGGRCRDQLEQGRPQRPTSFMEVHILPILGPRPLWHQPTAQHRLLPPPLGLAATLDSRICVMTAK
jgi:hypothetical protein